MAVDRSQGLLLGIFALQFSFVTREELITATAKWVQDRTRSLPELLQETGALSPERRELLEALIAEHTAQDAGDSLASLVSASSMGSLDEELRSLGDADIGQALDEIAAGLADQGVGRIPPSAETLPLNMQVGRFRVLRPHARGGLGHVSVAYDSELHREVALKEIKSGFASDSESRARFVQEAEITGSLEHPGIVPVYGLGTYPDGRPYYVMRFIRGDSLKDAIKRFHAEDFAAAGDRALALRQLLGRFIDVCNAVEYAHSRGVLHRDLKPGNIMLGRYGETLVVDWGLAKAVDREERHRSSGEATLKPSGSGSSLTLDGQAVGTPAYMSPEQATGKLEDLRESTDIYSLGGTLYCLLTGQAPFRADNLQVLLEMVRTGRFAQPRELRPEIPRPLEAICLKAMAIEPTERYASASELARDIERWMADEPVSSYSERFAERVGRVTRRHRGLTLAVICGFLLLAVAGATSAVLVNRERLRTESQLHISNALRLATLSEATRDQAPSRGGLLALAAVDATARFQEPVVPQAWSAVYNTLERLPGARVASVDEIARGIRLSPDGQTLLVRSVGEVHWRFDLNAESPQETRRQLTPVDPADIPEDSLLDDQWRTLVRARQRDSFVEVREISNGSVRLLRGFDPGSNDGTPVRIFELDRSPDGRWIVGVGGDKRCLLWDLDSSADTPAHTLELSTVGQGVRFAGGGRFVVARTTRGLFAFDRDRDLSAVPLADADTWSRFMEVSADGRWLATVNSQMQVDLRDFSSDPPSLVSIDLGGGQDQASAMVFSQDGRMLAVGTAAGVVITCPTEPAGSVSRQTLHGNRIRNLSFSPRGDRLAVTSLDRSCSVWNMGADGNAELMMQFSSHDGALTSVCFSPDGGWVYTGDLHGVVRRTRVAADQDTRVVRVLRLDGPLRDLAIAGDELFAMAGSLRVFGSPGKPPRHLENAAPGLFDVTADGRWLGGWFAGRAGILDLAEPNPVPNILAGRSGTLTGVDLSRDGQWLAISGDRVRIWGGAGGWGAEPVRVIGPDQSFDAEFSPDHSRIAVASRHVEVWSLEDAQSPPLVLQTPETYHDSLAFSPDGRWLAVGGVVGSVYVWDLHHSDPAATRQELSGHTGGVQGVCFDDTGHWMATASTDRTVRLWDFSGDRSGASCIVFRPQCSSLSDVAIAGDGSLLAAGDSEGRVFLWSLDRGQAAAELRRRIGRDFTPEELREFRLDAVP